MTLLDRPTDPHAAVPRDGGHVPGLAAHAAYGAVAALMTLLPMVGVALLLWSVGGPVTATSMQAAGVGVDGWLLAHGGRIGVGGVHLAVTPLLWTLLVVAVTTSTARRLTDSVESGGAVWRGLIEVDLLRGYLTFVTSYAAVGLLAGLATLAGPAQPVWWTAVLGLVGVPAVSCLVALTLVCRRDDAETPLNALVSSPTVRRAVAPGLAGAAVLLAVGSVVVLGLVAGHLSDVRHIQSELGAGGLGGVALWLGQLSAVPNLGLWAVSFLAGSGFQVVSGAATTWSASAADLMPTVPVLGALPQPGTFSGLMPLVVLVPVAVGVWVGQRALRSMPRLARSGAKITTAVMAAGVTAVGLGLLDGFAGGSWGAYRLGDVGAPAVPMTLLLFAEVGAGAVARVVVDLVSLHRR